MNTTQTLTVSEPVTLHCGQCESGTYYMTATDTATCDTCPEDRDVSITRDIERYLDTHHCNAGPGQMATVPA